MARSDEARRRALAELEAERDLGERISTGRSRVRGALSADAAAGAAGTIDPLVAALHAADLAAARAWVAEADALCALADATTAATAGRLSGAARERASRQTRAEAGWALGVHELTVGSRLSRALVLREQPVVRQLLLTGRLGTAHAAVALDELEAVGHGPEGRRVAAAMVRDVLVPLAERDRPTPSRLGEQLRRAAVRADPELAAERRREQEARRTDVRLRASTDGLADLTATGPALQTTAAMHLVDALVGGPDPTDERTLGQRRVDALLQALVAAAGTAVDLQLDALLPARIAVAKPIAQPGGLALPDPVVIRLQLPPDTIERLRQPDCSDPDRSDPDRCDLDRPVSDGPVATGPIATGPVAAGPVAASPVATDPAVAGPAPAGPSAARSRRRAASDAPVPELGGYGPVDPELLNDLLDSPTLPAGLARIRVRRLLTDRTGQVLAVDPTPHPAHTWERVRLPEPPPGTPSYEPTAAQQRVLHARDQQCAFPGCARPATRSDLDHRQHWPAGPTSTANLHPLCRHHHQLKQRGWQPIRHPDGRTTWHSPRGQTRTHKPV